MGIALECGRMTSAIPDLKRSLYSVVARKKLGKPNQLGREILGWSELGDDNQFAGLYSSVVVDGVRYQRAFPFYDYVITHTSAQNTQRSKFASAMSAWSALSPTQKAEYKRLAVGQHMSGHNLFIRYYMLS